jgi:hypothetical protein
VLFGIFNDAVMAEHQLIAAPVVTDDLGRLKSGQFWLSGRFPLGGGFSFYNSASSQAWDSRAAAKVSRVINYMRLKRVNAKSAASLFL